MAGRRRPWKTYEEASAWAQQEKITSRDDWRTRTKPQGIPLAPEHVYKAEWQGWRAFLGISLLGGASKVELILKHSLRQVLNLDPARMTRINDGGRPMHVDMADRERRLVIEYDGSAWHKDVVHDHRKTQRLNDAGWTVIRVRETPLALLDPVRDVQVGRATLNYGPMIGTVLKHLQSLVERGTLPDDGLGAKIAAALKIPIDETEFYDIIAQGWVSYEEASAWARQRGIMSFDDWFVRVKRSDFPRGNIPTRPYAIYKAEWQGWGAFLGTGSIPTYKKPFRSYDEARAWAQQEKITTAKGWKRRAKPNDIPSDPDRVYKAEWQGWGAFLGTGNTYGGPRRAPQQTARHVINLVKITDPENDRAFALQASV
ncbi:hypothetical protein PCE31106_00116 [Pandoraea cepalis]|uniref:DUF559 domain-containing protein n=1 Tax=Pandoraea cepalis TaxID=2508294 RepID=A0A5E4RDZ5_9BURK|nr:integrase repeat-containing protein [Pandoraea cepalis]VVD61415.1 hypothetical protein PCE31106_00116 [Pandoraea cepalis]